MEDGRCKMEDVSAIVKFEIENPKFEILQKSVASN